MQKSQIRKFRFSSTLNNLFCRPTIFLALLKKSKLWKGEKALEGETHKIWLIYKWNANRDDF